MQIMLLMLHQNEVTLSLRVVAYFYISKYCKLFCASHSCKEQLKNIIYVLLVQCTLRKYIY